MKVIPSGLILLITSFLSFSVHSQTHYQSLDVRIPFVPSPITIDGKSTIQYELHFTNFSTDSIVVKKMDVIETSDSSLLVSFSSADLKKRHLIINELHKSEENILSPGVSSILYMDYSYLTKKRIAQFFHRFTLEGIHNGKQESFIVNGAVMNVENQLPLVVSAPLKAGAWAAIYDPSWERGHRRVIYTVNGKAFIPGRFAIDFIKLNNSGHYAEGDDNQINNWIGYGENVLAVADGTIASVNNNFSESPTISGHPAYKAAQATGNYISIDIGTTYFAFYEHLKPGSIKVKPGQKVKKGDVIASVGFTGQTTGPHLHFHIASTNSALGAEGVPYVFEDFTLLGSYPVFDNFGKTMWIETHDANPLKKKERPASNVVIRF